MNGNANIPLHVLKITKTAVTEKVALRHSVHRIIVTRSCARHEHILKISRCYTNSYVALSF